MLYVELFDRMETLNQRMANLRDVEDHLVELALRYHIATATNHEKFLEIICKIKGSITKFEIEVEI